MTHRLGGASATPECYPFVEYGVEHPLKPALRPVLYRIYSARMVISGPHKRFSNPNTPQDRSFGAKRTIQNP